MLLLTTLCNGFTPFVLLFKITTFCSNMTKKAAAGYQVGGCLRYVKH